VKRRLPPTIHGNGWNTTEDVSVGMRSDISSRRSSSKKALLMGLGGNVKMRAATNDVRKSWRKYGRFDIYQAL
jgi:hypothetical protein